MKNNSILIIAEAGVNHNGDLRLAKRLATIAAAAGADMVKFQSFQADRLLRRDAAKAKYQILTTDPEESQYALLKKLELSRADHESLITHCNLLGIEFLSTPFDLESARMLVDLGLRAFKVSSGDLTNTPLLRFLGKTGGRVILSSGLADLADIKTALETLAQAGAAPDRLALLHCTTQYPAAFDNVNLRAITTLRQEFPQISIGYSDHSLGLEAPLAAAALGAKIIEKHFTLSRELPGPDHRASAEPAELMTLVSGIRNIERALGTGLKKPAPGELENAVIARKSIVAARDIQAGEIFTEENLTVKRPGNGLSPTLWDQVCGAKAKRFFKADEDVEL